MSMRCQVPSIPAATARSYADATTPADFYRAVGDALPELLRGLRFPAPASLPHHPSHVLPMITVFQYAEGLTDAQAVLAVRNRMDWKYALHLPADDAGFDLRAPGEFRRIAAGDAAVARNLELLLDRIVALAFSRSDSVKPLSAVGLVAAVESLEHLTLVVRTLAVAAEGAAMVDSSWARRHVPADLPCRSDEVDRFRLPADTHARERLARHAGRRGYELLDAATDPAAPDGVRDLPEMALLSHVWRWQFARSGRRARWLETSAETRRAGGRRIGAGAIPATDVM